MRLLIAIKLSVAMAVGSISLMRSERGRKGMIYTEIGRIDGRQYRQERRAGQKNASGCKNLPWNATLYVDLEVLVC